MSATGAHNEYSRGFAASGGGSEGDSAPAWRGDGRRVEDRVATSADGSGGAGPGAAAAESGAGTARVRRGRGAPPAGSDGGLRRLILAGALLAAVLLIAAEFITLYQVHLGNRTTPIQSVTAGSHNSYAMIPIGLLAAALGIAVWRGARQPALLAIGLLGVVALVIVLLGDLPDAHAVGLADAYTVSATTTPNAGLYMEALGAILLIATSGVASAMLGFPRRSALPARKSRSERQ